MLGIDLSDEYCQISYLYNKRARFGRGFINAVTGGVSREPVTFSTVRDQELYNIPMALCKLTDSPVWLVGDDARNRSIRKLQALRDCGDYARRCE